MIWRHRRDLEAARRRCDLEAAVVRLGIEGSCAMRDFFYNGRREMEARTRVQWTLSNN
jgi:hypothetical protein